jgi:S-adenosylmethionine:tRNA ribosyltransferase-isomerase
VDINLFDFKLPEDLIALRPVSPRDSARQLIIRPGSGDQFVDSRVDKLVNILKPGDLLVFNNTRVIPSRLFGTIGAAKVEVTLHQRTGTYSWWCFMKNGRRAAVGKVVVFTPDVSARVDDKLEDGQIHLTFTLSPGQGMEAALDAAGQMPLPPYIASKRPVDDRDRDDYQTVFAAVDGAVAAPTASLHFTSNLLAGLENKGVRMVYVTLHVGAGTFLPVKANDTKDHKMHFEWGEITPQAAAEINTVRTAGGRIIAVGTTALRLLESATTPDGQVQPFSRATDIFITPGYRFRVADMLMTNFHLPKSTLFMLVSAFAGLEVMQGAYAYAIQNKYRFYSYGDSSLIFRAEPPSPGL